MKTFSLPLIIVCLVAIFFTKSATGQTNLKKRIAVLDFEFRGTAESNETLPPGIHSEMADLITTELVKSKKFKVVERNQVRTQHFGGATTSEEAAVIGQQLNADLIVLGAILELTYTSQEKDVSLGKLDLGVGRTTANVSIDIRIVDTSNGEVINAEIIQQKKSGINGGIKKLDLSVKNKAQFDKSVLGKTMQVIVAQIINMISESAATLPWSAKVVNADTEKVYINSGALDGVGVGTRLKVFRPGISLIDPDTGLNLGSVDEEIGTITIIDNSIGNGKASLCKIDNGQQFDTGDIVRRL